MHIFLAEAAAEPLPVKNHSPVWFGLLYPEPDTAKAVPVGEYKIDAQFDYTSVFFISRTGGWLYSFDMEVAQATIDLRRGFANRLEIGLLQPVYRLGGGFLDNSILDFHSAFGFPDYPGQREAPRNRFLYSVVHNGKSWNVPAGTTFLIGDTNLWVKKEFFQGAKKIASVKILTQAPVSSAKSGLGNGAWEGAAVLALDSTGKSFDATVSIAEVFSNYIDRGERYSLKPFTVTHGSLSYKIRKRLHLIMQGSVATSPYAGSGDDALGSTWVEITFGARYFSRNGRELSIAFLEDLSQTAPDFTVHLSVAF